MATWGTPEQGSRTGRCGWITSFLRSRPLGATLHIWGTALVSSLCSFEAQAVKASAICGRLHSCRRRALVSERDEHRTGDRRGRDRGLEVLSPGGPARWDRESATRHSPVRSIRSLMARHDPSGAQHSGVPFVDVSRGSVSDLLGARDLSSVPEPQIRSFHRAPGTRSESLRSWLLRRRRRDAKGRGGEVVRAVHAEGSQRPRQAPLASRGRRYPLRPAS